MLYIRSVNLLKQPRVCTKLSSLCKYRKMTYNGSIIHEIDDLLSEKKGIVEDALAKERIRCMKLEVDWRDENKKVVDADIRIMQLEMEVEAKINEVNRLMEECDHLLLLIERRFSLVV